MSSTIVPSQLFEHSILGWTLRGLTTGTLQEEVCWNQVKVDRIDVMQLPSEVIYVPCPPHKIEWCILQDLASTVGRDSWGYSDEQWTWFGRRCSFPRCRNPVSSHVRPSASTCWVEVMQIEETSQMQLNATKCWGWETPFLLGRAGFRGYISFKF